MVRSKPKYQQMGRLAIAVSSLGISYLFLGLGLSLGYLWCYGITLIFLVICFKYIGRFVRGALHG